MSDYYDLGPYTRPVTTTSKEAQLWFDRGLLWCYGYNHDEAVRCFKKAAKHDPNCAMAHWGIAYAAGPNYNKQWVAFDPVDLKNSLNLACSATKRALKLLDQASPVEQALIRPLAKRYPLNEPGNVTPIWNDDYAAAMREVYPRPQGRSGCGRPLRRSDHEPHAMATLGYQDRKTRRRGRHGRGHRCTGARHGISKRHAPSRRAHMYLHLMEMSPYPERALRAGDALRSLVPDAGHLVHMPTHIDVLCGHYKEVIDGNSHAIIADRKYLAREGAINFYSLYRCHNYHFKTYGAMFLGQYGPALEAAEEMAASISEDLLRVESPPMADWLEAFRVHKAPRLHPLWKMAGDHRRPASRRPETLLCDHGHAALCQGRGLRRQFQRASSGKGSSPF